MSLRRAMFQSLGLTSVSVTPNKIARLAFTADGVYHNPESGLNVVSQSDFNLSLLDPFNISTGWVLNTSGDDWDTEAETTLPSIGDWSSIALERAVYTYGGNFASKNITITGLSAKTYKIRVAHRQAYPDAIRENRTKVTLNGESKFLENQNADQLYEVSFIVVNPVDGTIIINVGTDATYGIFCAMLIEQY